VWAGYLAGAIVLLRIVWEFAGRARYRSFAYRLATAVRHLESSRCSGTRSP
jgi:cytochrome b